MTIAFLVPVAWLILSVPFGIVVGRSIALADRRAADIASYVTAERADQ